jgi:hypothetical protein
MDEGKRLAVGTIHFPISKLPTCWRDWHFFDFIISYFQLLPFQLLFLKFTNKRRRRPADWWQM